MRYYPFLLILLSISLITCSHKPKDNENRTKVLLKTNRGDILIALYNETPLHRANFIKLTKQKFFDGTLFHRVINDFMIQGGDPDSKNASKGTALGNGGPNYKIPAEIIPTLFHKKGALAAARNGDNINPKRKSSGSQFYLVEGKVFTKKELDNKEVVRNANLRKHLIDSIKVVERKQIDSLVNIRKTKGDSITLNNFIEELNQKIDSIVKKRGFHFSTAQRQAYTTVGGVPHLDGAYTVFGEIIEGQEVVDAIAEVKTDDRNRPEEDIVIRHAKIVK